MDKKDIYLVISGFVIFIFLFLFRAGFDSFGPQPYPCDFSNVNDILILTFTILIIIIPLLFVVGSIDFLLTKKIFKTKKSFLITFGLLMIVFAVIAPFSTNHCTLKPTEFYKNQNSGWLEKEIISKSKAMTSAFGSVENVKFISPFVDEICFKSDNKLQLFYKKELLKTSEINNITINENPLCFESKNKQFEMRMEGKGKYTQISRIS